MVIGYERTTMTWSPGKIHSELGILSNPSSNAAQPSNNMGLAPMEIDRFEKGKNKGKSKGKSKGKDGRKGKGKSKNDKGKGKSNKGSGRAAISSDQCLHCGKYGHFKRDCWKLNGRPDTKNVNQVESSNQSATPAFRVAQAVLHLPLQAQLVVLAQCVYLLVTMTLLDLS